MEQVSMLVERLKRVGEHAFTVARGEGASLFIAALCEARCGDCSSMLLPSAYRRNVMIFVYAKHPRATEEAIPWNVPIPCQGCLGEYERVGDVAAEEFWNSG